MKLNRLVLRWIGSVLALLALSGASFGQVFVSVRFGPPALPVYAIFLVWPMVSSQPFAHQSMG